MFGIFIGIDYLGSRQAVKQLAMESAPAAAPRTLPAGEFVEGFFVPAKVRYHPGHAWAQRERTRLMRVKVWANLAPHFSERLIISKCQSLRAGSARVPAFQRSPLSHPSYRLYNVCLRGVRPAILGPGLRHPFLTN